MVNTFIDKTYSELSYNYSEAKFKKAKYFIEMFAKTFSFEVASKEAGFNSFEIITLQNLDTDFKVCLDKLKKFKRDLVYNNLLNIADKDIVTVDILVNGNDEVISKRTRIEPPNSKIYKDLCVDGKDKGNNEYAAPIINYATYSSSDLGKDS